MVKKTDNGKWQSKSANMTEERIGTSRTENKIIIFAKEDKKNNITITRK